MSANTPSGPEKDIDPIATTAPENEAQEPSRDTSLSNLDLEKNSSNDVDTRPPPTNHLRPVVTAQDWTGPDDPENPMNWALWKKAYITTVVALLGFAITFASSVYTPAYPEVAARFHVSRTASLLGLSVYVFGLAFGPVIAAPISEAFGRNVVYKATIPISMLFTLGAGFSNSFGALLVCRFLAAFTGSGVLAVGAGTSADIWLPRQRAKATSTFLVAPFLGPALGPFIGGFVAQYKSWRWTQWSILFITLTVYIFLLPTHETYKKIILGRRARRLNLPPPPSTTPPGFFPALRHHATITITRPIHMLFVEPIVLFFSIYTAFAFSVLFCFFAAFPYVFKRPPYGFSTSQAGLVFLAVGLGVVIAGATSIIVDAVLYQKQHRKALENGKAAAVPEYRLYAAMMGSLGLPVGMFWFGWAAQAGVHWAVLVVAMVPFAWGNLSLFISTALYLVDTYGPRNGASALAANGILRYACGAVFPLFTIQMYETLGIGWATSLLAFISVAMVPIPWLFFKYGSTIRNKSHYDTVKF